MARVIDRSSAFVGKTELNLFGIPPTQVATERSTWHVLHPRDNVPETGNSTPITFQISGIPDFIDIHKNLLKVKFRINKADGSNIDATNEVAPINYISNTFIKQLKIFLNNKVVYDSQDTYIYRCFFEAMINYSDSVKKTHLEIGGWRQDEFATNSTTLDNTSNPGYIARKNATSLSKQFEVLAPLHSDLFNQTQYLLPNVDLRVEIYRNPTNSVLVAFDDPEINYELHILQIEWMVRRVEINKNLSLTIEKMLLKTTANYPIKKTIVHALQIDENTSDLRNLLVYNGQLPTTMILGFVEADAFYGALKKTPFYFKPFNLEKAQAIVGGKRYPQDKPLEMNFPNNEYTEVYWSFINNTGFGYSFNESNGINANRYKNYCFFLVFDFRSDQNGDSAVDLINHGETRIYLKFRQNLANNVKIIAYLSFDNILRLDAGRNAILDYSN